MPTNYKHSDVSLNNSGDGERNTKRPRTFEAWKYPASPSITTNPLLQLEILLDSLGKPQQKEFGDETTKQDSANGKNDNSHKIDDLLVAADFLFGSKLMSAALALVDSCQNLMTQLVAPSGRMAYLIQGSKLDETYLCLCRPPSTINGIASVNYCSCRSFLEKASRMHCSSMPLRPRRSGVVISPSAFNSNNHSNHSSSPPICKHLLALKLLPHLEGANRSRDTSRHQAGTSMPINAPLPSMTESFCPQVKPVTEEEFASIILNRTISA
jgi:hypothetical protein